jgi:hypothetical protein
MHQVSPFFRRASLCVNTDFWFGSGDANQNPGTTLEDQFETVSSVHFHYFVAVDLGPGLATPFFEYFAGALGERDLGASEREGSNPIGQCVCKFGDALAFNRHHLGSQETGEDAVPFGKVS